MAGVGWLREELIAVADAGDGEQTPVNLTQSFYSNSLTNA
jgi:hypothetical protein